MSAADGRSSPWLELGYSTALYLLLPAVLGYTVVQSLRARELRYLRERLGLYRRRCETRSLWLHAASVGEVAAAESLIRELRQRSPGVALALSTGTPAGAEMARRRLPADVAQLYLPVDLPGAVRRFLDTLNPRCALIMETELWPNLYAQCASRAIPVLIINARVSQRTLRAQRWLRRLYAASLERVAAVLARSAADAAGFVALGAPPERVKVIGNIKLAAIAPAAKAALALPRPYVLAASTHADEELRLAQLWRRRRRGPHLLVIAPRHPPRLPHILEQLAPLHLKIAVRSRGDTVRDDTELYIVDTLGELNEFMVNAEIVFVGGSLVPRGGHNVLEPARLARPIVFGAHMGNFAEEAAMLLERAAAIQVTSDDALETCITRLLSAPGERAALGARAREAMQHQGQVLERYLEEIALRCAGPPTSSP